LWKHDRKNKTKIYKFSAGKSYTKIAFILEYTF
jgi:hypothetical protein